MRPINKARFPAAFISFYFLTQITFTFAQERSKPPESVLTLTKTVTSKMKYGEGHRSNFDVQGRFIYTITEVRSDDSITGKLTDIVFGKLVYEIPREESLRIAKHTGVPDNVIPASIEQDNA